MTVKVKDQEFIPLMPLKKLIDEKKFSEAYQFVEASDQNGLIKKYNLAYVKYKEGNMAESLAILQNLKFSGLNSQEVRSAIIRIKQELDVEYLDQDYSRVDHLVFFSAGLPEYFFPGILVMFLFFSCLSAVRRKLILTSVLGLCFLLISGIYYKVNSFQVEINAQEVTIYKGPSKIFEQVQVLPIGASIIFSKKLNEWSYIDYPTFLRGWVYKGKAIKQ